jgi:hypothetical protein
MGESQIFRLRGLVAFIIGTALSSSSFAAATLEAKRVPVSVNYGDGYKEVVTAAGTRVPDGAQVMVGPGGHARIVYSDGCVVEAHPGSVVTVGKCYQPMRAGLEEPVEARPFPWVPVIIGAAIIAGGVCAVVCDDDDDRRPQPRSP